MVLEHNNKERRDSWSATKGEHIDDERKTEQQ